MRLFDSLINLVTGMGTGSDKSMATSYVYNALQPNQLENMYRSDWIARKAVNLPAQDATREWRSWQADLDIIEKLEATENRLQIRNKVKKALILGRTFGGGALILGTSDAPESPLDLATTTLGIDSLQFVHVLSRYELELGPIIEKVDDPWYGEPEFFKRMGANDGVKIHPSRVIRFGGNEIVKQMRGSVGEEIVWGDSILQVIDDAVKAAGTSVQAVATMIQEGTIDVYKIKDLTQNVANVDYRQRLLSRLSLANTGKSMYNALITDANEEWDRKQANFGTLPDLIMTYMVIAAGAADIPATRMLGQSPKGLNATGESDLLNYYDNVGSQQKNEIQPAISRLDELIIRSAMGSRDPSIFYNWNPLWQMTEAQKAEVTLKKAQAYQIDFGAWNGDPVVLQKARQDQLIDDGVYPTLEMELQLSNFDIEAEIAAKEQLALQAQANAIAPVEPGQAPRPAPAGGRGAKTPQLPPPAAQKRLPAPSIKDALDLLDMEERPLYVYRKVLNGKDILAWAKAAGFTDLLEADDLHVTILYSKGAVDWMKMGVDDWGSDDGSVKVAPGGPRVVQLFGAAPAQVAVLTFLSSRLMWRHEELIRNGGTHDYPDFAPHITFSKNPGKIDKPEMVTPYRGPIELGPEIFEDIKPPSFRDAWDADKHPRLPAGGAGGGQFASGSGVPNGPADNRTAFHNRPSDHPGDTSGSASALYDREAKPTTPEEIIAQAPAHAMDRIKEAAAKQSLIVPTITTHKTPDGRWTRERSALHDTILASVFTDEAVRAAMPARGEQPTAVILGGRGGSGKSWVTSKDGPVDRSKFLVIDPDEFKNKLPEYKGWNSNEVHEESSYLSKEAIERARQSRINVVIDTTMASATSEKQIKKFRDVGYRAESYYVFASPETAARRSLGRFLNGGKTGRYVPLGYILGSTQNERHFDALKTMVDKWGLYDNNKDGVGPQLVAKSL
ncbi:MAG: hypothetical protein JWN75_1167 [Candidatus Saccharibacteria bacterium]|nr:hypothetical protein [Candidatus Saccharibacteria bacterium]